MPIFEIQCEGCGFCGEVIVLSSAEALVCPSCGSPRTSKLISATSSLTGSARQAMPGPSDHGCCGSRPAQAGCAGPGSCCGRSGAV